MNVNQHLSIFLTSVLQLQGLGVFTLFMSLLCLLPVWFSSYAQDKCIGQGVIEVSVHKYSLS